MTDLDDPYWQENDHRARIAKSFLNMKKAAGSGGNPDQWEEHALDLVSCCHQYPYVDFISILPHWLPVAQEASLGIRIELLTYLVQFMCTNKILKANTFDPIEFLKSTQDLLLANFSNATTEDQSAFLLCGLAITQQHFEVAGLLHEHLRQKGCC